MVIMHNLHCSMTFKMKAFSNSNFAMFLHFLFEGNQTQDVSYISSGATKNEKDSIRRETQKKWKKS